MNGSKSRHRKRASLTFPELFALPVAVDLTTAAHAVGISINTAYKLVRQGLFPCKVLRIGYQYRVPTSGLMECLGIENIPVSINDVDRGAEFSSCLA
ncbi:helix-turn-helix domain-containing protein [Murinocardiopsis flavida]|uniref:helix-turn-helix domain-containing protein n=1 Tax=Murinocardiopsis flavida TaxID=645275 RepID=UPI000D0DABF1|nr:helix-turn-helix domain-containing protein [Murinocardiopsis flavida]